MKKELSNALALTIFLLMIISFVVVFCLIAVSIVWLLSQDAYRPYVIGLLITSFLLLILYNVKKQISK